MPDSLRLSLTTFTVLPLRPGRVDRRVARGAMVWAPVVGVLLALAAGTVLYASRLLLEDAPGPLLPSVLAISTLALLTRGLHLDGLADTADGLSSHAAPARALEIMRSPEVGPLGVAAVVLTLLVQVSALTSCVQSHRGTESLLLAVLTGRLALLWACTAGVPAARAEGLGALVAGTVPRPVASAWTAAVAIAAFGYGLVDDDAGSAGGGLRAVVAVAAGLVVTWGVRRHAVRRLGGVTGDVLGAQVEIAQAVVLVGMATGLAAQFGP